MPAAMETIPKEILEQYFHMSLSNAANHFGVSQTFLKKVCREHDIKRWPFRKVKPPSSRCNSTR